MNFFCPFFSLFLLFLSFFFFFFFLHCFCSGLLSLEFSICCINENLEESSGLVTCSRWWNMGWWSIPENIQTLTEQVTEWEQLLRLRAVGSSPKFIRKNPVRRIQKNLKNIIWYSSYKSSKTGKCNILLVFFIIFHS